MRLITPPPCSLVNELLVAMLLFASTNVKVPALFLVILFLEPVTAMPIRELFEIVWLFPLVFIEFTVLFMA